MVHKEDFAREYLDAIFAGGRNNFTRIELKIGDRVLELHSLYHPACSKIPES